MGMIDIRLYLPFHSREYQRALVGRIVYGGYRLTSNSHSYKVGQFGLMLFERGFVRICIALGLVSGLVWSVTKCYACVIQLLKTDNSDIR